MYSFAQMLMKHLKKPNLNAVCQRTTCLALAAITFQLDIQSKTKSTKEPTSPTSPLPSTPITSTKTPISPGQERTEYFDILDESINKSIIPDENFEDLEEIKSENSPSTSNQIPWIFIFTLATTMSLSKESNSFSLQIGSMLGIRQILEFCSQSLIHQFTTVSPEFFSNFLSHFLHPLTISPLSSVATLETCVTLLSLINKLPSSKSSFFLFEFYSILGNSIITLLLNPKSLVTIKTLCLNCLSTIFSQCPSIAYSHSPSTQDEINNSQLLLSHIVTTLQNHSDPIIRGNVAILIASFLSGFMNSKYIDDKNSNLEVKGKLLHDINLLLSTQESTENETLIPYLNIKDQITLLCKMLKDKDSVSKRLVCQGINLCIPFILKSKFAFDALELIHSTFQLKNDSYQLVKIEVIKLCCSLDYQY